ncbi:MAG: hypothetical protein JSV84_01865, partial [Gemmatimonadota bacterium]
MKRIPRMKNTGMRIDTPYLSSISLAAALILTVCVCGGQQPTSLDDALALYYENRLEQALPLLQRVASRQGNDAETHAWLAETCRRLRMKDNAVTTAMRALQLDPCNSFAHTVIADACHRPPGDGKLSASDTTVVHINRALGCDSTDGNGWVFLCVEAMLRGKFDVMR